MQTPSLRLLCSGKRLRGVVGGLRRIGLLRFWVGSVVCDMCDKIRAITFRVVAQASSRFWRPCWVVEGLRWGVALVLLEPCELLDGVRER